MTLVLIRHRSIAAIQNWPRPSLHIAPILTQPAKRNAEIGWSPNRKDMIKGYGKQELPEKSKGIDFSFSIFLTKMGAVQLLTSHFSNKEF